MILSYQHFQGTSILMVFVDFQGRTTSFPIQDFSLLTPSSNQKTSTPFPVKLCVFLQETIDAMWQAITIVNRHLNNKAKRMVVESPLVLWDRFSTEEAQGLALNRVKKQTLLYR